MGALVAVVLWMVTIAFIWALMLAQAQSAALTGVGRVGALAIVLHCGRSALCEATAALRHPPATGSPILQGMLKGQGTGDVCEPAGTRALYADEIRSGSLKIDPVKYTVVHRGAASTPQSKQLAEAWLIDLSVRVHDSAAGADVTRQLVRRVVGSLCVVRERLGPQDGKVVFTELILHDSPVVEVVEP